MGWLSATVTGQQGSREGKTEDAVHAGAVLGEEGSRPSHCGLQASQRQAEHQLASTAGRWERQLVRIERNGRFSLLARCSSGLLIHTGALVKCTSRLLRPFTTMPAEWNSERCSHQRGASFTPQCRPNGTANESHHGAGRVEQRVGADDGCVHQARRLAGDALWSRSVKQEGWIGVWKGSKQR